MADPTTPLAMLLLDEYLNAEDTTGDGRLYGRDFYFDLDDLATPYVLRALRDVYDDEPPPPARVKVKVLNGVGGEFYGMGLYGERQIRYGSIVDPNTREPRLLTGDEVEFADIPAVDLEHTPYSYTFRAYPKSEDYASVTMTIAPLARGEQRELEIECPYVGPDGMSGGGESESEPIVVFLALEGGTGIVSPPFCEIDEGSSARFELRPAAGYVATQVYWPGGGVRDLSWWDDLKRRLAVNVVHTVSWDDIARAWSACRYSGLSSLNKPLIDALNDEKSGFVAMGRLDCHVAALTVDVSQSATVRMASAPYSLWHVSNQIAHLEHEMADLFDDLMEQLESDEQQDGDEDTETEQEQEQDE